MKYKREEKDNPFLIDPVTVLEAILMGRQTRLEIQCLYGNPMLNNFYKTSLLKHS